MNTQQLFDSIYELLPDARLVGKGYLLARCPWHEDSRPSLLIYRDGWWHCLGECSASGPNSRLYAELSSPGTTRRAATDTSKGRLPRVPSEPAEMSEFVYDAHQSMLRNSSYRWYAERRGIENRIEPCKLGWYQGWLTIPVFDVDDLAGVVLRAGPQAEKLTGARFTQPEGQRPMLYMPDIGLVDQSKHLYVVFGMVDALALAELRLAVVTTTGGDQSFNPTWLDWYRRPIYVVPDRGAYDPAAELVSKLGWRGKLKLLRYGDLKDPAEFVEAGRGADLIRELEGV